MKAKCFFAVFLSAVAGVIGLITAANYYLDYYEVFRGYKKDVVESNQINDRFVKMKYLLHDRNFEKYDSYLWGSSRVMKADTRFIGEKTYNLGVPTGMTEDALEQLQILLQNGAEIKAVYVGLDDLTYCRNYSSVVNNLLWISYKDQWNQDMETYIRYLLTPSIMKQTLKADTKALTYYLGGSGMVVIPGQVERDIEENVKKHIEDNKFSRPRIYNEKEQDVQEFSRSLNNLKEIKEICEENNIQLKIFFNPQHMAKYLMNDMELMNRFKKELVKISPFWDFSGANVITSNNYFWYETSHPRAFVCDKILDTVSGKNCITGVPDFGVYVTPENVDDFCEKAVRDRETYDPSHEQWIPNAEERAVMTKRMEYPG